MDVMIQMKKWVCLRAMFPKPELNSGKCANNKKMGLSPVLYGDNVSSGTN